jgi:hypothetical protein
MPEAELDTWLTSADCMRDNGLEMVDPDAAANMPPEPVRDPTVAPGLVENAPTACEGQVPSSARVEDRTP